jgi:transposase-like protein
MEAAAPEPKTFLEAVQYFANIDNCIAYLANKRWSNGIVECPTCGRKDAAYVPSRRYWQCKTRHPKAQFSVKVGTIFEDSPIGLDKWLPVMWQVASCKNGVSSWEISRNLGVTQKTAWFMLHRIRLAMQDDFTGGKLGGEVEVDETFIGGKARNMHKDRKWRALEGAGGGQVGKTAVIGLLERGGKVRTQVIPNRKRPTIQAEVRKHVEPGSPLYTDQLESYRGLNEFEHQVIDHAVAYVNGQVHTNGLENFWSLLKRGLGGTYVSVEPFHLFRYVDEQAFRYNTRKDADGEVIPDAERFGELCRKVVGKRLTYAELTGKVGQKPEDF